MYRYTHKCFSVFAVQDNKRIQKVQISVEHEPEAIQEFLMYIRRKLELRWRVSETGTKKSHEG
jgi:hypothetical protein